MTITSIIITSVILLIIFSYLFYQIGKSDGMSNTVVLFIDVLYKSRNKDRLYTPQEILDRMKLRQSIIDEFRYELEKDGIKI